MDLRYRLYCLNNGVDPHRFAQRLRELVESERWDVERIRDEQAAALRDVIAYAVARVPWQRERFERLGLEPADFKSVDDLRRVPILERHEYSELGPRLLPQPLPAGSRFSSSSGTSGRAVRTPHDAESTLSVWVMRARAMARFGVRPWERHGIPGAVRLSTVQKFVRLLTDPITGRCRNWSFRFEPSEIMDTIRWFRLSRPHYLVGQPWMMHRMRHFAHRAGVDLRRLGVRLAVSACDVLTPFVERSIRDGFACPVLSEYGCTEVGSMAHQCPQGTLHLNPEHAIVEIIDQNGERARPGAMGRVVLTSLHNLAMPLIRYAVGDVAVPADAPCSCGLQPGLPGLQSVEGRVGTVWRDAAGRYVPLRALLGEFQEDLYRAGYWETQFVQHAADEIELRVRPRLPPPARLLQQIASRLREPLGCDVHVRWSNGPVRVRSSGKMFVQMRKDA